MPSHSFALARQTGQLDWVRHYAEMFVPADRFFAGLTRCAHRRRHIFTGSPHLLQTIKLWIEGGVMKARVTVLAAVAAAALITTGAVAQAQQDDPTPWNQMDRMHNSEQMREMRDQMPDEARELCEQMHAEMPAQMGRMMGEMHRAHGPMHTPGWGR